MILDLWEVIAYKDIFSDNFTFEDICEVPASKSIELLADIINITYKEAMNEYKIQSQIFDKYFNGIKIDKLNLSGKLILFSRIACLRTISTICIKSRVNKEIELTNENKITILKCILHYNSYINPNPVKPPTTRTNYFDISKMFLINHLPFFDIQYPHMLFTQKYSQIIQLFYLSKFLHEGRNLELLNKYYKNKKLTISHYFRHYYKVVRCSNNHERLSFFINDSDKEIEQFENVKQIGDADEDNQSDPFLYLRQNPLMRVNENIYFVSYLPFVIDKLYHTLFFDLQSSYHEIRKGDFRQYYTKEFSENTLLCGVLNETYKTDITFNKTGIELEKIGQGFIDYYLRENDTVFLFENKDNIFKNSIRYSSDYKEIINYFREKFVEGSSGDSALNQLSKNILKLFNGDYATIDSEMDVQKISIFPVIVVHDYMFNVSGLNYIVNTWFKDIMSNLLKNNKITSQQLKQINDVTIVFINDLVINQNYIISGQTSLDMLLKEYIKRPKEQSSISFNYFVQHFTDTEGYKIDKDVYDSIINEKLDYILNADIKIEIMKRNKELVIKKIRRNVMKKKNKRKNSRKINRRYKK